MTEMRYAYVFWGVAAILSAAAIAYARRRSLSWRAGWYWVLLAVGLSVLAILMGRWGLIVVAISVGAGAFLYEQTELTRAAALKSELDEDLTLVDEDR